ncbi:hypothetical protein G7046_g10110 [Stylonectria norvegica]|nr:hypothetical protein G7046_g10110 [Stylonectria norvegica]
MGFASFTLPAWWLALFQPVLVVTATFFPMGALEATHLDLAREDKLAKLQASVASRAYVALGVSGYSVTNPKVNSPPILNTLPDRFVKAPPPFQTVNRSSSPAADLSFCLSPLTKTISVLETHIPFSLRGLTIIIANAIAMLAEPSPHHPQRDAHNQGHEEQCAGAEHRHADLQLALLPQPRLVYGPVLALHQAGPAGAVWVRRRRKPGLRRRPRRWLAAVR